MTEGTATHDTRPGIFISHRHDDREIAKQLQRALDELLGDTVRVFNTSDERAKGFELGGQLSAEIRKALSTSSLVILLYTMDDADWRWCFFECGVANDPDDDVATTTVVFDFQTRNGTKVFDGDLHITIQPLTQPDDPAPADFRRFIADLGTGQHRALAGRAENHSGQRKAEEYYPIADDLYRKLNELGPTAQRQLTEEFLTALDSVPAEFRRQHFQPLFQGAADALRWGLGDESGVRDLFISYWDDQLLNELTRLSTRRLVFRPGRVYLDWKRLLELCGRIVMDDANETRVRELGRPILALVSHEAGRLTGPDSEFIEFWRKARKRGTDAAFYEGPVRRLARELHGHFGDDLAVAERVFVIDRNRFSLDAAEQLAEVATWMAEAHISTVVTFEDLRREQDLESFDDFGLVGWTAVSRFSVEDHRRVRTDESEEADLTSYRSLEEDFADATITAAEVAWHAIPRLYEWSGPGECDPEQLHHQLTADD